MAHAKLDILPWRGALAWSAIIVGVIAALAIHQYRHPKPACDPDWPVYQCNGTAETNSPRCCP